MNISDCLDYIQNGSGATNSLSLNAYTIEERELIQSIAKLLYHVKSVRKAISILDQLILNDRLIYIISECEITGYELDNSGESKHEQEPYSGC